MDTLCIDSLVILWNDWQPAKQAIFSKDEKYQQMLAVKNLISLHTD